jgi:site-specific recombinase XerD
MKPENENLITKQQEILSFRDLADRTITTYISYLTQFLSWVESELPGRPVSSVTWEEVRAYISYLRDVRGIGNRTVNVHIAQLHHLWQYVLKRDWDKYEVPFLRYDEKLPVVPTVAEINAVIETITNPKHKAEIALLYSSGMRVSELCRLRCGDIYRSRNSIFIARSKNRAERYAVLSEKAFPLLVSYIRSYYPGATKEDFLFPGQKPGSHIDDQSIRNVFYKAVSEAGLADRGFVLHSCRHAFGLHLYEAGTDLMSIKEALGHKSLSSTEVYLTLGIGNGRSVKSPYDL